MVTECTFLINKGHKMEINFILPTSAYFRYINNNWQTVSLLRVSPNSYGFDTCCVELS